MKHFLMCLLYIAALGVLSFVVGRLIPKHWFHADRFPWVCHPAEQKLWKRLHVRKWQAKIPDMSRIFVKIMPEKKLTKENYENLPRMIFCEGTPIYKLLSSGAERMYQYIRSAGYDNIICTHVFPALALTEMRRQHPCLQLVTSHISTDYTCAPCTADSALDWYFIPSTSLLGEFEQCGLQPQKLIASGIPVRQQFYQRVSQEAGKANAGISPAHQHILMMCGSMGCGPMEEIISYLCPYLTTEQELSVVCGTNDDLRKKLQKRTEKYSQVHVLGTVNNVPQLMQASDLFLTKPGGLSTSEAMAAELPMVLIDAVAGCETHNLNFFLRNGMAVTANTPKAIADTTIKTLNAPVLLSKMRAAMRSQTECTAADKIYEWIYSHAK